MFFLKIHRPLHMAIFYLRLFNKCVESISNIGEAENRKKKGFEFCPPLRPQCHVGHSKSVAMLPMFRRLQNLASLPHLIMILNALLLFFLSFLSLVLLLLGGKRICRLISHHESSPKSLNTEKWAITHG